MKKALLTVVTLMSVFLFVACDRQTEYVLGETFEFDGLEITIGEEIGFGRITNASWPTLEGEYYFYLPVMLTNISDKSNRINMFDHTVFAPDGSSINIHDISSLFTDYDIAWEGYKQPGTTVDSLMHILYAGDGEYIIEFGIESAEITVRFELEFDFDVVPEIQTEFTLGETFEFDGFEVTIGDDISWGTITDKWTDNRVGEAYFFVPITATNHGDETHGLAWHFNIFNPNGITSERILHYIDAEDFSETGPVRAGATINSYIHFLFEGNGDYVIEFNNWDVNNVEVIFNVSR